MKSSAVKSSLRLCYQARRPVFLWGPPGVGKSQVVRQVAEADGLELRDVRAVLLDPVDLRGLPSINGDGRAHWAVPDFLPRAGSGLLFLDELNAAPPLVQAACYQLILDRALGEYRLPDDWQVVGAGNRVTDRAVVNRMSSALGSRFIHVDLDVDLSEWVAWALGAGVALEVVAFLRFRPSLLHVFDAAKNERTFPCPRTWEFVSDVFKCSPSASSEFELFSGVVGEGAAAEFVGFLKVFRSLPDVDALLLNPSAGVVPSDPAVLYALAGALARKATAGNFQRVAAYAARMPSEFSVLLVRDAVRLHPDVQSCRAFVQWASDNSAVLL